MFWPGEGKVEHTCMELNTRAYDNYIASLFASEDADLSGFDIMPL